MKDEELMDKLIEELEGVNSGITPELIKKASKEELLKYLELTEKIRAKVKRIEELEGGKSNVGI